ncbi:BolA family transcriptional regulator [Elioraea sp.]|jgi:BolA protein|uniref:BolA family protein n=1 Tax=Elioraea sp. TaxID=2185103 RepID=UPI0021DD7F91|nr:BolA family protein [Elioraea sp.]GIX09490.1 MAG: cell division protein BolA [Elioraea sp.]
MTATRAQRIRAILEREFLPVRLTVEDESARHAGHAGNPDGRGETHYAVVLVSPRFTGMGRLARSRAVHTALAAEFATGLHALSLTLKSPEEAAAGTGAAGGGASTAH